ncbi:MAG: hypothetical protein ACFFAS_12355 [Promethearchaeota archaeon]
MVKKKSEWLMMPKVHSNFNDTDLENALLEKSSELISIEKEIPNFIFLCGNFFDVKAYVYSALRAWKGAVKPTSGGRKPMLEATFASLSVYISSLLSLQSDFYFAYDEIREILINNKREDLWAILEEKLPFISLPPKEMYGKRVSPISPYFVIKQDDELTLGEIYPSVYLTQVIKSIKSRFFVFFQHQGYSAFGFFNSFPTYKKFGFEQTPRKFTVDPTPENLIKYVNGAKNLKEVLIALINSHNNAYLSQYLIDDYELLLKKLLEA